MIRKILDCNLNLNHPVMRLIERRPRKTRGVARPHDHVSSLPLTLVGTEPTSPLSALCAEPVSESLANGPTGTLCFCGAFSIFPHRTWGRLALARRHLQRCFRLSTGRPVTSFLSVLLTRLELLACPHSGRVDGLGRASISATPKGNLATVRGLLGQGADPDGYDLNRNTALNVAARDGHEDLPGDAMD